MSYGWMGRTPDYKAALMNTLGANADWYGPFKDNALAWHKRAQEAVLFMNHAIVNPPIDRHKPAEQVKDVFVHITKETDAGIYVSGAKVVATSSALTHYNFLAQSSATVDRGSVAVGDVHRADERAGDQDVLPRLLRADGQHGAAPVRLSAVVALRRERRDPGARQCLHPLGGRAGAARRAEILSFHPASGFMHGYCFQGCTRFAVKLDFLAGLLAKALRATGGDAFRGNQAALAR